MRWGEQGGQAILSFRALVQSNARTYLQGGGYDSRQCRADTQLAMIGVSDRVTPNEKGVDQVSTTYRHTIAGM